MPTSAPLTEIRSDFDAIAELMPETGRLGVHEDWILQNLPSSGGVALELGCGAGHLSREMAKAFRHVDAVDFSEAMIAKARRSAAPVNFVCSEMFAWLDAHPETYDCVVTVATLHHVDLASALKKIAIALKRGGRLLVLDLEERPGLWANLKPFVLTAWRRARVSKSLQLAYRRHGRKETYLRLDQVRQVVDGQLPGAEVRSHLMWRYSIRWEKP